MSLDHPDRERPQGPEHQGRNLHWTLQLAAAAVILSILAVFAKSQGERDVEMLRKALQPPAKKAPAEPGIPDTKKE